MAKVVVATPGTFVTVRRGMLVLMKGRGKSGDVVEIPVTSVDELLIASRGVTIVSKALIDLVGQGIPVYMVRGDGAVQAMVWPAVPNKTVETRRAQYVATTDGRGLNIAKALIESKIVNKAWLLKYLGKSRRCGSLRNCGYRVERQVARLKVCNDSACVLEAEAAASRTYWDCIASNALPPDYRFRGRDQDGGDPINAALNYGYAILRLECMKALMVAGLDPYAGFLHVDKSGRPSLTLDFMEPFRFAVDKAVIELSLKKSALEAEGGLLTRESRKWVADAVLKELHERRYRYRSAREALSKIIKSQAAELAHSLRTGEGFKPFKVSW